MYGADGPEGDAEVITLADRVLRRLGLKSCALRINSIGCADCRPAYREALVEYFRAHEPELCPTCRERLETNPLRILDCKSPVCAAIAAGAPKTVEYLCGHCRDHFTRLQKLLDCCGIPFAVDPRIVRGLDYYTGTVFEFISEGIGAQGTVCGGGRYGGLLSELGGPDMSGVGFGMGLTRLLLAMQAEGALPALDGGPQVYLAPIGDDERGKAFALTAELRALGVRAETDLVGRSLKAQMKYADKLGAQNTIVLGTDELSAGECTLLHMATGEKKRIPLSAPSIAENL